MPKSDFPASKEMGKVIRSERLKIGCRTQKEFSERMNGFIGPQEISFVETGRTGLSNDAAQILMKLFGCDRPYLCGESPYKTQEERTLAKYSDFRRESAEKYKAVQDAITIGARWKRIGTIGMLYKITDGKQLTDGTPHCVVSGDGRTIDPNKHLYVAQYYVFETPKGKRVVSCMEFEKFLTRVLSFMSTELDSIADHLPAFSGWDNNNNFQVSYGEISSASLINFFNKEKGEEQ